MNVFRDLARAWSEGRKIILDPLRRIFRRTKKQAAGRGTPPPAETSSSSPRRKHLSRIERIMLISIGIILIAIVLPAKGVFVAGSVVLSFIVILVAIMLAVGLPATYRNRRRRLKKEREETAAKQREELLAAGVPVSELPSLTPKPKVRWKPAWEAAFTALGFVVALYLLYLLFPNAWEFLYEKNYDLFLALIIIAVLLSVIPVFQSIARVLVGIGIAALFVIGLLNALGIGSFPKYLESKNPSVAQKAPVAHPHKHKRKHYAARAPVHPKEEWENKISLVTFYPGKNWHVDREVRWRRFRFKCEYTVAIYVPGRETPYACDNIDWDYDIPYSRTYYFVPTRTSQSKIFVQVRKQR